MLKVAKVVIATGNSGKLAEIQDLLSIHSVEAIAQTTLNIAAVEETGLSFVENAILKARHAAKQSGLPAIGDDSGLEVDALNGQPGIYSSRYAGESATDQQNIDKLLLELGEISHTQRHARFRCVIAYMQHHLDPSPIIGEGVWPGFILTEKRGERGFGYDPVFWVPAENASAAEMSALLKNSLSHRGQALRQLAERLE